MPSLLPINRMLYLALAALRRQWWRLLAVAVIAWAPFGVAFILWAVMYLNLAQLRLTSESLTQVARNVEWGPGLFVGLAILAILYVCAVCLASNAGGRIAQAHVLQEPQSLVSILAESYRRLPRSASAYIAITGSFLLFTALVVALTLALAWAAASTLRLSGYLVVTASVLAAAISAAALVPAWLWVYSRLALAPVVAAVAPSSSRVVGSSIAASHDHRAGILGRALVVSLLSAVALSIPATVAFAMQLAGVWLSLVALALRAGVSVSSAALQTLAMTPVYYSTQESFHLEQDRTADGPP